MMGNLMICIAGYTDTISVYVNDKLINVSSLLKNAKYTYTVPKGVCNVKIIKRSGILEPHWKKIMLNWFSCLSGIPDFTLKEAILESNISSICFNINITDAHQITNIKLLYNFSGFKIIEGIEKCEDIHAENTSNCIATKRIKIFYLLPAILLLILIIGFLIGISIFFAIKSQFHLLLIVVFLIVMLSALFAYFIKSSK